MDIPQRLEWIYWKGEIYQVRDRSQHKRSGAVTLYCCNCQEPKCTHIKRRVSLAECRQVVTHAHLSEYLGYIYDLPFGEKGICVDVMWLKGPKPIDYKTKEPIPLPPLSCRFPSRHPTKDIVPVVDLPILPQELTG